MKRIVRDIIGITLFVMGYYQVHRQSEYKNEQNGLVKPITDPSPAALPAQPQTAYAFSVNHSFIK